MSRLPLLLLLLAAARSAAAPTVNESEGIWRDELRDLAGIAFRQNVKIGPSLTPGVRVSLSQWSWTQSYTPASDSISTPFSNPSAAANLVQVLIPTGGGPVQQLALWQRIYSVANDLALAPGVGVTTLQPSGFDNGQRFAVRGNVEQAAFGLTGSYLFGGATDKTSLVPGRDYTATLHAFWCDDPDCKAPSSEDGAELGVFSVAFGGFNVGAPPVRIGSFAGIPAGDFWGEQIPSPVTVEWTAPNPLPPGAGWEYRLAITMTNTGAPVVPPCAPNCSATVWLDTVTVMAKGHPIPVVPVAGGCPPGTRQCFGNCVPDAAPCGWDAATRYVDTGSYLSPVFDSLSPLTRWEKIWWSVDQHFTAGSSNGWPRTPIAIKWRVGNSPDPSTWLPDATWYTWTIPNSVTCSGEENGPDGNANSTGCLSGPCDCSGNPRGVAFPRVQDPVTGVWGPDPPRWPMHDEGEATMYADGLALAHATGRYFQYEVDFTGQYANARFPPEQDSGLTLSPERHLKEVVRPVLNSVRAYYLPARGQALSVPVQPTQLRRWRSVEYTLDLSAGGTVEVDVLDAAGIPLFTNVPSGYSLAGLDPSQYPSLRLRASVDNGGISTQRPTLTTWSLRWDTFTEPLQVDRNAINPSLAELCKITVVLTAARGGGLDIHDAAGQIVRRLFRGVIDAGVRTWLWDGRNDKGEEVVSGVYYVSLQAKEIKRVRKIAVVRR